MQSREFGLALPCVASVSVRFQSKEPGARVKDRAKKGRVIQHFFALDFLLGQNRKSRSSVFLCSEVKRKRLLSRRAGPGPGEENLRTMGRKQPAERQIGERERAGGEVASCHPVRKEYFLFMYLFYYSS